MMFTKIATITKAATLAAVAGAMALGLATSAAGGAQAASGTTGTMYGNPAAAAPPTVDDCLSTADVGEMTGTTCVLIKCRHADAHRGTSSWTGQLLAHYGIKAKWTDATDDSPKGIPATMESLEQLLGSGHKVIVSLNGEMIWRIPIETKESRATRTPTTGWS